MIKQIKQSTEERMSKSIELLNSVFAKIRTGRANSSLLDAITVSYYGSKTPLSQIANITIEDARTLAITVWEKKMVPEVEKVILKSGLGLNPSTAGEVIRILLPPLTKETRKIYTRQARQEAENIKIAIRNIRRDSLVNIKKLEKAKAISEDDEHRAQDNIQQITDRFIAAVDIALANKEKDLMTV